MKKDVSLLLLVSLIVFSIPLLSLVGCVIDHYPAYMSESDESLRQIKKAAYDDASNDASNDGKIELWLWCSGGFCLGFGGGCLLGSLGVVAAYFRQPSPPPTRFLGKPPEYIDVYVSHYKSRRNNSALGGACLGCAAGAITAAVPRTPWAIVLGAVAGKIVDERGW